MKTYHVTIPVTMAVTVTVEAEDEDAAIDAAFEVEWGVNIQSEDKDACVELDEMECHRIVAEGNCYYGVINRIEVNEEG